MLLEIKELEIYGCDRRPLRLKSPKELKGLDVSFDDTFESTEVDLIKLRKCHLDIVDRE